jgi:hypothetical protein
MKVEFISVVWWIKKLTQPPCLISKWTVHTAQHNDHVIRHMPHAYWDRHPIITRRRINVAIHMTKHIVGLFIRQYRYYHKSVDSVAVKWLCVRIYFSNWWWRSQDNSVSVSRNFSLMPGRVRSFSVVQSTHTSCWTHPFIKWVPGNPFLRGKVLGAWSWPRNSTYCCG